VAMRTGSSTINYLLGDHLGSQAITADANGGKISEVRYYPWGGDRYYAYTSTTTFRFIGQRFESGIGLYFYNARWYDSSAGRFVNPDTIIPGTGNPQGWDRFAYVRNNPINRVDPTGHKDEGPGYEEPGYEEPDNLLDDIDDWLWDNVPSAFGVHVGVNGQIGAIAEVGIVGEIDFVFNWRSGQMSVFGSTGPFGYVGTPTILNATVYGGGNSYYGVSDNQFLEGFSGTLGGTLGVDAWGKLGVTVVEGMCVNPDMSLFVDPGTENPIHYNQASANLGLNAASNVIEGGGILGLLGSSNWFTWDIPFWP